jgi:hypothetical protein
MFPTRSIHLITAVLITLCYRIKGYSIHISLCLNLNSGARILRNTAPDSHGLDSSRFEYQRCERDDIERSRHVVML